IAHYQGNGCFLSAHGTIPELALEAQNLELAPPSWKISGGYLADIALGTHVFIIVGRQAKVRRVVVVGDAQSLLLPRSAKQIRPLEITAMRHPELRQKPNLMRPTS